ncbi:MAG: hypothetical protein Crog4KO_16480 [Crocinitomicaceae bacterium]
MKYKIVYLSIALAMFILVSCQTKKFLGEYGGEYKDLSNYVPRQKPHELPEKKYKIVSDSNGVIIGREEDDSYLCHGGGVDRYLYEEFITPYMSQSISIYKKKGIKIYVSFHLYPPSFEFVYYSGTGEVHGDTLITKLRKDLTPNVIGDTLFENPITVKYLINYDEYEKEYSLYYSSEMNQQNIATDSLWRKDKTLTINNANTM